MKSENWNKKNLSFPVQYLKGIGPKRAKVLTDSGIRTVRDLLYYFPFDYLDFKNVEKIGNLRMFVGSDKWITAIGYVRMFDLVGRPPRQRLVVVVNDDTGSVQLVFFKSINFFKRAFSEGDLLAVSGKVTSYNNRLQFIHPSVDRLSDSEEAEGELQGFLHTKGIIPKYGSTEAMKNVNLNVKGFRRIIKSTLDEHLGLIAEFLPSSTIERLGFISERDAVQNIHFPESFPLLDKARYRLKFDELFSMQLLLALRRKSVQVETPGIAFNTKSSLARKLVDSLPFNLTKSQKKVIAEIASDMNSAKPMQRLLQGDVGSGKTIVSLLAMLIAVENGYQTVFMAPTEILAEQHHKSISSFLNDFGLNIRLLIGGQRSKERDKVLDEISSGSAHIVVGTHALIQKKVQFENLGLIVIDEQHRFGVSQRVALRAKGASSLGNGPQPDIIVMTATPIPRTLSLTLYGDLDVSIIDELPAQRIPVKTFHRSESQTEAIYSFIREQIKAGRQVYIVYPLVEESEKLDLKSATESYEKLKSEVFTGLRIGLLHGRMSSEEKDSVMSDFKTGETDILVATTVIEVGIDIPNASVMVIEHAERFGLSQLHQLRGRVGRGAEQSYCILVVPDWMKKALTVQSNLQSLAGDDEEKGKAIKRIQTMIDTTNGFIIAEIDLELRGPGDFFGTRQSGLPLLQIANLLTDGEILKLARREAFDLVEADPHLRKDDHRGLRKHVQELWSDAVMNLLGG